MPTPYVVKFERVTTFCVNYNATDPLHPINIDTANPGIDSILQYAAKVFDNRPCISVTKVED